jgi:hypothetical protein
MIRKALELGWTDRAGDQLPWAPAIELVLRHERELGRQLAACPTRGLHEPLGVLASELLAAGAPEVVVQAQQVVQAAPPTQPAPAPLSQLGGELDAANAEWAGELALEQDVRRRSLTAQAHLASVAQTVAARIEVEMARQLITAEPVELAASLKLLRSMSETMRNLSAVSKAAAESELALLTEDPRKPDATKATGAEMSLEEARATIATAARAAGTVPTDPDDPSQVVH